MQNNLQKSHEKYCIFHKLVINYSRIKYDVTIRVCFGKLFFVACIKKNAPQERSNRATYEGRIHV